MTYQKNPDITYVAMCIYFDANIYRADRNDNLLYQYLYHVVYMLASKGRYFKNFQDYDDFAIYATSRLYLRYPAKEVCAETPVEKRIKSILNYTKATVYPLKVDYQRENFSQVYSYENDDGLVNLTKVSIQKDYSKGLYEEVVQSLRFLPKVIKKIINETPYKNDVLMSKKLYMSCLLTFINGITLSNSKLTKILSKSNINEREELFIKSLQREKQNAVMTWHLDDSYKDYIKVLTSKIRRNIDNDLTDTQNSFNLTESELDSIIVSAFSNSGNYYNEEEN